MARVDLTGGMYQAKSVIAGAQRCVNLYPEKNQDSSPATYTNYPRSGLRNKHGHGAAGRCIYRATNGQVFEVIGTEVYYVPSTFAVVFLGFVAAGTSICSMSDNGIVILLVDGTGAGYTINLTTHAYAAIVDAAFYGSTRSEYMDSYFVLNRPGSTQMYLSPPFWNGTDPFDALDVADKIGGADLLQVAAANASNIQLIGTLTSEIWFNSGAADFPFERVPSVFIEHGTPAPYSVAQNDVGTYFLSQDDDGGCIFLKIVGYEAKRFSTHAIEAEISKYATVSDCVAMTYQQEGHAFVRFSFPTADKTWVWDEAAGLWHEQTWTDTDGIEHRHRVNQTAYGYGMNLGVDWEFGTIYQEDPTLFIDQYPGGDTPLVCRRGFPHILNNGKRLSYAKFIADMAVGTATGLLLDEEPLMSLRWSDTRGASWGEPITTGVGSTGEYNRWITFWQLGLGQDRVFEIFWSAPYPTALQGAFIEATPAGT